VLLPDKPTNQNILWLAGVGDESVIRSKRGDIEKSRFYTDSIMVATEHALLDLEGESPRFQNTAKACSSFIRRAGAWMDLGATSSMTTADKEGVQLKNGDELLVGNSIFRVVLSIDVEPKQEPSEGLESVVPPPLPEPSKEDTTSTITQGSLFESISEEPASDPVAIQGEGVDIDHPDAAPKPLFLKEVGFDSIIMDVRDLDTNPDGDEKEDDDSSL
jgi:hypothetical protein